MTGSAERVARDLAALEEQTAAIASQLEDLYGQYLDELGRAVFQQLISTCYHLCTQANPKAFLRLGYTKRETLQRQLRMIVETAQGELNLSSLMASIQVEAAAAVRPSSKQGAGRTSKAAARLFSELRSEHLDAEHLDAQHLDAQHLDAEPPDVDRRDSDPLGLEQLGGASSFPRPSGSGWGDAGEPSESDSRSDPDEGPNARMSAALELANSLADLLGGARVIKVLEFAGRDADMDLDTEQSDTEQSDTERSDTEQSDTEQSDTERSNTEQSDAEQSDAGLNSQSAEAEELGGLDGGKSSSQREVGTGEPITFATLRDPLALSSFQGQLEDSIQRILRQVSQKTTRLMEQYDVLNSEMPKTLAERSRQTAESVGGPANTPPHLVSLVLEPANANGDKETPSETRIQLVTIYLRLAEIEFANPVVMAWRNRLRGVLQSLEDLAQSYQRAQRDKAVVEAEEAWRSSWPSSQR